MQAQRYSGQYYLYKLLLLLLIFIGSGLALAFSISYSYSILKGRAIGENSIGIFSLFIKQLVATIIGLIFVFYLLKTPTKSLRRISSLLVIISGIAMIYTAFFGPEINGSRRWLVLGGVSIQTGDFARISIILYLSDILAQYHKFRMGSIQFLEQKKIVFKLGFRFFTAVIIYVGTLYFQSDYSSLIISGAVILSLVMVSDVSNKWKIGGLLAGTILGLGLILSNPNRLTRILNYFQPVGDPLGTDFQILRSYKIIGNGGILGGGIGSNMLDVIGLPYFNNDFVFSIVVGEFGLLGALLVLALFWAMCWYSYKLSRNIYRIDRYYYYLILAGTVNIVVAVVAHVAVTIGIIPTTGLNLPFYSSGGSSMITSLISYGLILRGAIMLYNYEIKNKRHTRDRIQEDSKNSILSSRAKREQG